MCYARGGEILRLKVPLVCAPGTHTESVRHLRLHGPAVTTTSSPTVERLGWD